MTYRIAAKTLQDKFPTLSEVIGRKDADSRLQKLVDSGLDWEALCHQAESDLQYLSRRLAMPPLKRAYAADLRNTKQIRQTVYEIYAASLLASISDDIEPHFLTNGGKDCDFRIKIRGCEIYGDVRTRLDNFPFNKPPIKDDSGEQLYTAVRATVDPHVAEVGHHPEVDEPIPESTVKRQRIEEALPKFPATHPSLIVLGFLGDFNFPEKIKDEFERVLFGDDFDLFRNGKQLTCRHQNGIITDPRYGQDITSVAWLSLKVRLSGTIRRSGIFFNPQARHHLSAEVEAILEGLFDREKILNRELTRIVEKLKRDYQPEKIILFGSLAQGDVKEGSDIDLTIIKDTDKRPLDRCLEVATICQPSLAANFLVYTPREFRQEQEKGNFFVIDEILKRGRVLYER